MEKKIAVIFGDGIGPEVTQQSIKVLNAVGQRFGHVFHYTEALWVRMPLINGQSAA